MDCLLPMAIVYARVARLEAEMEKVKTHLPLEQQQCLPEGRHKDVSPSATPIPQVSATSINRISDVQLRPDVITKRLLTLEQAELLLEAFQKMAHYCPFVALPEGATVSNLRPDRPFLLLAILASSSTENRPLQISLHQEFLSKLSEIFIAKGYKSLDMLQGLLVYMTWYISDTSNFFYVFPLWRYPKTLSEFAPLGTISISDRLLDFSQLLFP